jgi:hypothetical protein
MPPRGASFQLRRREFPVGQMIQEGLYEVFAAVLVVEIIAPQ